MATLFCEMHNSECAGITHVPSIGKVRGGYQARASAELKKSEDGETTWLLHCPDTISGDTKLTPWLAGGQRSFFNQERVALQHQAGKLFVRKCKQNCDTFM